ncbi:adenylate/guanylate cyclase domain-containing protein [Lutimonas zeaxanthinifaciens]|uniref:adenylate/guanylate cyclase domain-containing protein n=1 Tax=Lutimonas zeaxanthinifaciens TaxID=3060215 RepID=UPI00265D5197|nr:adenylate/guanylate cyclase domain-containing protein [Lutimonas sp. YSD2104]WKK67548.1 adenylate/guanylate cyclase domain-containing protein [Lutimonas sp. YSD2104]
MKIHTILIILSFLGNFLFAQDQKKADSLILQYRSGAYSYSELKMLAEITDYDTNYDRVLQYSELIIQKAAEDSIFEYLYAGHLQKGNALTKLGNNVQARESYLKAQMYAWRMDDQRRVASTMTAVAGTYSAMENYDEAEKYYVESIELFRSLNEEGKLGTALVNLGDLYITMEKYSLATKATNEGWAIFKRKGFKLGEAYCMGNTGMIQASLGHDEAAEANINEAIKILDQYEDYYPIAVYLTYMSDIYLRKDNWDKAYSYAKRSLELSEKHDLQEQIAEANLKLSLLYEYAEDYKESNAYLKKYYSYRENTLNLENVTKAANLKLNHELSLKQTELDLMSAKQYNQRILAITSFIALILILLLLIGLLHRNHFIKKTSSIIAEERDRSESLLCNILPEKTAQELKQAGRVKAKHFEAVTVMFTDFKAFTINSGQLSPEELVESIDFYFSKFDQIMEKYGLEKIKTIGDAYMCAGGLPFPTHDHANRILMAAFEIKDFVEESKISDPNNLTRFDIRIGINTGPVVAGVVGTKKFAYDIWGDTVNIASRMESNSIPGKINISENTYQIVKDQFHCSYRGEIECKYNLKMKMYFVNEKINQAQEEVKMNLVHG